MTVAFQEVVQNLPAGAASTVDVVLASIAVGDLVVVTFESQDVAFAGTLDSVTDTLGNVYLPAGPMRTWNGGLFDFRTFYTVARAGGASPTVTGTYSASCGARANTATRYSLTGTGVSLDGENAGSGFSTSPMNSGNIVTTGIDLLYGFNEWSATAPSAPTGWTDRGAGAQHQIMDLIGAAPGTVSFQPTFSGTELWGAEIVGLTEQSFPMLVQRPVLAVGSGP